MLTSNLLEREKLFSAAGSQQPGSGWETIYGLLETPKAIPIAAPLKQAIELFRDHPGARFLAVVDDEGHPLGAVHEQHVRDLLFSPFGHALLANPGCRWTLRDLVQPCPTGDLLGSTDAWIRSLAEVSGAEGLIVTQGGRYEGLLPGAALLQLAAMRDREAGRRLLDDAEAALERSRRLARSFEHFRADAALLADALVKAASEILQASAGIAERAALNSAQAQQVAAASVRSASGVAEVAASSSQLAEQVGDIEEQVAQARQAARDMVAEVVAGASKARGLSASADQIGEVVELISSIATRVNLLALNATIEAARAGEAGLGFRVVAGEVKALALQAGEAADQIASKVQSIRAAVRDTSRANHALGTLVGGLDLVASNISDAVGQQSQATGLIARNVEQSAIAASAISSHIGEMGGRAEEAGQLAAQMRAVADGIARQADRLSRRVTEFLDEVKAA